VNIDHNVQPGPLRRCQVCGSGNLELVLDVGHQPLCDSLLTKEQLDAPETFYPLRLLRCPDCTLAQLDYVVDGSTVYHPDYPYRTGVTKELVEYQLAMAAALAQRYGIGAADLVVDIGSNDGTLLKGFKRRGARVVGVEPTQIGKLAQQDGIETCISFFDEEVARRIVEGHGNASLIVTSNTFAHMANLGDVVRGIRLLLKDDGVLVVENHYLVDVLEKLQYDTIYHEHIRTYSLASLVKLFSYYGLTVFHAERVSRYGGNIRVHVTKGDKRPVESSVHDLLKLEENLGLAGGAIYRRFGEKVRESRIRLLDFAVTAAGKGSRFVGNSCPGRANTLLHYCDINIGLMPYIAEQPASLKKGLYSPGKHIPVVDNSILFEEQPEHVVLLAWHYAEAISADLRARGLRSKLIVPLPECKVLAV
jgi:SAM-dependent methyltransferase